MFVEVDELDPAGNTFKTVIQTDQIATIKHLAMDFSQMCQVCMVSGGRVARHDYNWCEENDYLDEYHERVGGPENVKVTLLSMHNGDTLILKGEPQLVEVVKV